MMKWINCVFSLCLFGIIKCNAMSESELEDFENFLRETSQLDQNLKSKVPELDFDEGELMSSDNAWEESGKFEGDLILNERQRRMIVANLVEGLARNGLTDSTKRWPNNEVIYFIQREHFNLGQVQAIEDGIADLARASCVKFTPYKKGDRDAVVIQGSRRGCFSQVGYQGGYQVLNLSGRHPVGRGCFRHGTVVHELLHTLGFYHMQSSPDRDDYIDVAWENIIQATRHNFRKYNSFAVSDFGVGYDYESVLHYSRKAFSVNGKDTLIPKQSGAEIGQRIGLSEKDTQKLNKMYCDAESDLLFDSDSPKAPGNKKRNDRNKPFEGRGIGYHQGKAVAIQLPAAQTYFLKDMSNIDNFNDFSKTQGSMSPMPVQGFGVAKEISYSYAISPNKDFDETQKYRMQEDTGAILDDTISNFRNIIKSEMDPSDARKLDYEQYSGTMNPNLRDNSQSSEKAEQEYSPFESTENDSNYKYISSESPVKHMYYEDNINQNKQHNSFTKNPILNNLKHKFTDNRYYTGNEEIIANQKYDQPLYKYKNSFATKIPEYNVDDDPNEQYDRLSFYIDKSVEDVSVPPNLNVYQPKQLHQLATKWSTDENTREPSRLYSKEFYLHNR